MRGLSPAEGSFENDVMLNSYLGDVTVNPRDAALAWRAGAVSRINHSHMETRRAQMCRPS